jgi:hypothetical protein
VLEAEKISSEELQHMLAEAAFTSLRGSNLRYVEWLFVKKNGMLQDMQRVDLVEIGRGQNRMLEEHESCHGDGCHECGWAGEVSRAIEDGTAMAMQS